MKLSESKKVELLENSVLNNDIESVKKLFEDYSPIEFTARALGLACRFAGAEMVSTLLNLGINFEYEATSDFKRKYNCNIKVSNNTSDKVNYLLYLLTVYTINGYSNTVIADEERSKVISVLKEKGFDLSELLYNAIMMSDNSTYELLIANGISRIPPSKEAIISGQRKYKDLFFLDRVELERFQRTAIRNTPEETYILLTRFLECMSVDKYNFFPNMFSSYGYFLSTVCSNMLFDFCVNKTNTLDLVKKSSVVLELINQNNAEGFQYVMNKGFITKASEINTLLKQVTENSNLSPLFSAILLEKQAGDSAPQKATSNDEFSLDDKPVSAAELKKIWGTRKRDNGTLEIISYKGDNDVVVIPAVIGKTAVTAIANTTFDPNAPRVSSIQKDNLEKITSIVFPGSIREIPSELFGNFGGSYQTKLTSVILEYGIETIKSNAFSRCLIKELVIPDSIKVIEQNAFANATELENITLPANLREYSYGMLSNTNLKTFEIPSGVTKIPNYIFSGCSNLKTVTIPDTVTEIGMCAFADTGLEKVSIPDSVESIGKEAFFRCQSLEEITLSQDTILEVGVFTECYKLANKNNLIIINDCLFGTGTQDAVYNTNFRSGCFPITDEFNKMLVDRDYLPTVLYKPSDNESNSNVNTNIKIGDEITFGRFPEDVSLELKPLKWIVLDINDRKALLITKDEIMEPNSRFNNFSKIADSGLRKLLCNGFYNVAFNDTEKERIQPDSKENREDLVFLLTAKQVEKYLPDLDNRKSNATEYAFSLNPINNFIKDYRCWYTYTLTKNNYGAATVIDRTGEINYSSSNRTHAMLRPSIWIKL